MRLRAPTFIWITMKLVGLGLATFAVVCIVKLSGGASPESRARAACENLAEQCASLIELGGEEPSEAHLADCTNELVEAQDELGDNYDEATGCLADADSCGAAFGCVMEFADLDDVERAFKN